MQRDPMLSKKQQNLQNLGDLSKIFKIFLEMIQEDRKQNKWSLFWMAIALCNEDLSEKAWDGMDTDHRIQSIFGVFESRDLMDRIVPKEKGLFVGFLLRLLTAEQTVECIHVNHNDMDSGF